VSVGVYMYCGACGKIVDVSTFELVRARVFGVLLGRLEVGHVVIGV
jgi:hypothetical protein